MTSKGKQLRTSPRVTHNSKLILELTAELQIFALQSALPMFT